MWLALLNTETINSSCADFSPSLYCYDAYDRDKVSNTKDSILLENNRSQV